MVFRCANVHPQRAKHAINDHFHSCAVPKPLTDMAHHNPQKKTLTLINGQLAAINVKTPRGAQISTCEAPKTTMVRKCVQSTQKGYANICTSPLSTSKSAHKSPEGVLPINCR